MKGAVPCGEQSNAYHFAIGFAQHAAYHLAVVEPMTPRQPHDLLVLLRKYYTPSAAQGDAVSMFLDDLILQVDALEPDVWDGYLNHRMTWHDVYHRGDCPVERFPKVPMPEPLQDCPEPVLADLKAMVEKRDPQANNPLLMLWRDVHVECCRTLQPHQFQSNPFHRLGFLLGACLPEMEHADRDRLMRQCLPPRNLSSFLDAAGKVLPDLRAELDVTFRNIVFGNVTRESQMKDDGMYGLDRQSLTSVVWAMFNKLLKPIMLYVGEPIKHEQATPKAPPPKTITEAIERLEKACKAEGTSVKNAAMLITINDGIGEEAIAKTLASVIRIRFSDAPENATIWTKVRKALVKSGLEFIKGGAKRKSFRLKFVPRIWQDTAKHILESASSERST